MACHNTLVIPSACAIGVVTPSSYSLNIMIGGHHGHDVLVISRGRGGSYNMMVTNLTIGDVEIL